MRPRLEPLQYSPRRQRADPIRTPTPAYRFASRDPRTGDYLDFSRDGDEARLRQLGLPVFHTPEQLAAWLEIPPGVLAWLTHRFDEGLAPQSERFAHYHFHWKRKRSGGWRLIESPKAGLKRMQNRILREILDRVPLHPAAHGFARNRSVLTNALPHAGRRCLVKFDLENFYPSVTYGRVTAVFRALGYSREAAIWLARLTTSRLPPNVSFPEPFSRQFRPFLNRHLPQGAPTSPALANLSAYGLDVRLSGLARSFGAAYTRYADDLTFSGPDRFLRSLPTFLPLAVQIVRRERFLIHRRKRKVLRSNQRQTVAGVVVNERPNVSRKDFDRLKAILHNCLRYGPAGQNRDGHPDFAAHLRGRIAHVMQLNAARGEKLLAMYRRIPW